MNSTLNNRNVVTLFYFLFMILVRNTTAATVVKLPLQTKSFKTLLISESNNYSSSPYFIRCYDRLCKEYVSLGNRSYILLGLQRPPARTDINIGYILGESKLSRNLLTADIFYINFLLAMRGCGHGKRLLEAFETEAKFRSSSVGVFSMSVRIVMKNCIRASGVVMKTCIRRICRGFKCRYIT